MWGWDLLDSLSLQSVERLLFWNNILKCVRPAAVLLRVPGRLLLVLWLLWQGLWYLMHELLLLLEQRLRLLLHHWQRGLRRYSILKALY